LALRGGALKPSFILRANLALFCGAVQLGLGFWRYFLGDSELLRMFVANNL
jgi:hypothetical protein